MTSGSVATAAKSRIVEAVARAADLHVGLARERVRGALHLRERGRMIV
jgi:hypothetical protein